MKWSGLAVAFVATIVPTFADAQGYNQVRPYVQRDGTYVQPHFRTNPDSSFNNNWSTRPNTNPFTGQQGYRDPSPGYGTAPRGYGASPSPYGGYGSPYSR